MQTASSKPGRRIFRWSILGGILAAILSTTAFLFSFHAEPEYQGVALSAWLDRYDYNEDADVQREEAADAIRHIGANAIPVALRWLRASDPKLKTWLIDFLERHAITAFSITPASVRQERGATVFEILDSEGAGAIPELAKLIDHTNSAEQAAHILCFFGMDAYPALMGGMTNRNPEIRAITAREMLSFRQEKANALPLEDMPEASLLAMLQDSESSVRQVGARGIGIAATMGKVSPATSLPALNRLLGAKSSAEREEAAWAIEILKAQAR